MIDKVINMRYKLISKLGQGGMGEIFLAQDLYLEKRQTAVKFINLNNHIDQDFFSSSFKNEFAMMTALEHPNLVKVYDFGKLTDEFKHGNYFIAMEYLDGQTLSEFIKTNPSIDRKIKIKIFAELLLVLNYIHTRKIIYHDIKPENIIVLKDMSIRLIDFGLAKKQDDIHDSIKGTVHYLAPEVLKKERYDHRIDIFSAGIILFEMITGDFFYKDNSMNGITVSLSEFGSYRKAVNLKQIEDDQLYSLIKKMTAYEQDFRYKSCNAILSDLKETIFSREELFEHHKSCMANTPYLETDKISIEQILKEQNAAIFYFYGSHGSGKTRILEEIFLRTINLSDNFIMCSAKTAPFGSILPVFNFLINSASEKLVKKYSGYLAYITNATLPGIDFKPIKIEKNFLEETLITVLSEFAVKALAEIDSISIFADDFDQWNHYDKKITAKILTTKKNAFKVKFYSSGEKPNSDLKTIKSRQLFEYQITGFNKEEVKNYIIRCFGENNLGKNILEAAENITRITSGRPGFIKMLFLDLYNQKRISYKDYILDISPEEKFKNLDISFLNYLKQNLEYALFSSEEMAALFMLSLSENDISVELWLLLVKSYPVDLQKLIISGKQNEIIQTSGQLIGLSSNLYQSVIKSALDEKAKDEIVEDLCNSCYQILSNGGDHPFFSAANMIFSDLIIQFPLLDVTKFPDWEKYLLESADNSKFSLNQEKSIKYLHRIIQSNTLTPSQTDIKIQAEYGLGQIEQINGNLTEAKNIFKRIYQQAESSNDNANIILAVGSLAFINTITGNNAENDHYQEILENKLNAIENIETRCSIFTYLAQIALGKSNFEEAIIYSNKGLALADEYGDTTKADHINTTIATTYMRKGDYKDAIKYLLDRYKSVENSNNYYDLAIVCGNLGIVFNRLNDNKKSEFFSKKHLSYSKKINYKLGIANASGNVAQIYYAKGRYDTAVSLLNKRMKLDHEMNNKRGYCSTIGNLGIIYNELGHFDKAEKMMTKQLALGEELKIPQIVALCYLNLSNLYEYKDELEKSISFSLKSLDKFKQINNQHFTMELYYNTSLLYLEANQIELANDFNNKALEISSSGNNPKLAKSSQLLNKALSAIIKNESNFTEKIVSELKSMQKKDDLEHNCKILSFIFTIYKTLGKTDKSIHWASLYLDELKTTYRDTPTHNKTRIIKKIMEYIQLNSDK